MPMMPGHCTQIIHSGVATIVEAAPDHRPDRRLGARSQDSHHGGQVFGRYVMQVQVDCTYRLDCRLHPLRPIGGDWEQSGNHERSPDRSTALFRSLVRGFTWRNMDPACGGDKDAWPGVKGSPVQIRPSRLFSNALGINWESNGNDHGRPPQGMRCGVCACLGALLRLTAPVTPSRGRCSRPRCRQDAPGSGGVGWSAAA
jgi:hypothetical protein